MSARIAVVSAGLLIVSGAALSQPQPGVSPAPPAVTPLIPAPGVPTAPAVPPPPPEKTVDDLLNELERIQAQKAALEKQEADLKAALRKKLDAQAERLKKVGGSPQPDNVGRVIVEGGDRGGDRVIRQADEPNRIGRIIVVGFVAKDEEKVREALGMAPGEILKHTAFEDVRDRLKKAGFTEASVEISPSEICRSGFGSRFKDIRVWAAPKADR